MSDIKRILLMKGFSRYNALRVFADCLKTEFEHMGITVDVVGEDIDNVPKELESALDNEYDAILSMNGVLADQEMADGTLYADSFDAPFIAFYVDHPCANGHRQDTPINRYYALEVDQNYVNLLMKASPNIRNCGLCYQAGIEGDYSDKAFADRKDEVLFVGTYKGYDSVLDEIKKDTTLFGTIKSIMCETGVKNPSLTLEALFDDAVIKAGAVIDDGQYYNCLYGCQDVEYYLRSYFRENAVASLVNAGIPVTVYGNGWENLPVKDKSLITTMGNCDFAEFPNIISNYKYVLNVLPWSKAGFHDRIANTMLNGAISITDESTYINACEMDKKYLLTYKLDELDKLGEIVSYYREHQDEAASLASAGYAFAKANHTWRNRAERIIEYVKSHAVDESVNAVWGDISSEFKKRGYSIYLPEKLNNNLGVDAPKYLMLTHQLSRTGAPMALLNLANRLSKKGDVLFMCPEYGDTLRDLLNAGYPVVIAPKYWDRKFVFKGFAKKFDAVCANTVLNFPAVILLDGSGIPVYWWIHEHKNYFDYGRGEIPNPNAFKDNIHTFAVSSVVRDVIKKEFDYEADIFPYGVEDYQGFLDTKANANGPLHFLVVGPLTKEKGQDLLLNAYTTLPGGVKDRLMITFVGALPDMAMAKMLNDTVMKEKNLFYSEPMPHDELMKLMANVDGIIVPSRQEMLSTVAAEAMSLSKCVISANAGGIATYIENGVNGYTYETEDTAALNSLLSKVTVNGRATLANVGSNGRKVYDEIFSMEAFDRRIESYI